VKLRLCAIGRRLPGWLEEGVADYVKRLPKQASLEVLALKASKKPTADEARAEEAKRLLAKAAGSDVVVALDERGQQWSTRDVARRMAGWRDNGQTVSVLIGGADGLAQECRDHAAHLWGLSNLTLPHGVARLLAAEQLYRSWSLLNNHPYHRE
jgi:23S rRNA (pseudouridine1915-N3)-methyltransferase